VVGDEVGATYRSENIGNTPAILQKSSTEIRCLPALLISPNYSTQRTWGDRIVYSREAIAGMRCMVPKSEKDDRTIFRQCLDLTELGNRRQRAGDV